MRPYLWLIVILVGIGGVLLSTNEYRSDRTLGTCVFNGRIEHPDILDTNNLVTTIDGWAFAAEGLITIDALTEQGMVKSVPLSIHRPDIHQQYNHCDYSGKVGFSIPIGLADLFSDTKQLTIRAKGLTGTQFEIGTVAVDLSAPFGINAGVIQRDKEDVLRGWAIAASGDVRFRVSARGQVLGTFSANKHRSDVGGVYKKWGDKTYSGIEELISMRELPRGRYQLEIDLQGSQGHSRTFLGAWVYNDFPIGTVVANRWRSINPERIHLRAWVADEDGLSKASIEIDGDGPLRLMRLIKATAPFSKEYARAVGRSRSPGLAISHGTEFSADIALEQLPLGLSRLNVRAVDEAGNQSVLPGPLILRQDKKPSRDCAGDKLRIFFPGDTNIFRSGFPQMQSFKAMVDGGCVEVGINGRVEYLRTTLGVRHDYGFDPDFPDTLRIRPQGEMSTSSLNELLKFSRGFHVPVRIVLDGGVWADSKFPAPDVDIVDMLEKKDEHVQWNQFGLTEADNALTKLPGSFAKPQLARMMSLNRFNEKFLFYKKRNLQAAIKRIKELEQEYPELDVTVNFDPDQYINPWFYLKQWYDYNPDTLKQFREWLFWTGPYADGAIWSPYRYKKRVNLDRIQDLAKVKWESINQVEPPRNALNYNDPWQQIWTQFKRHLVGRHYNDLVDWAVEAGMDPGRIFTSQTFIQADVAVTVDDIATGWTDQAGVSIEGAKPERGHLGAILYGPASRNEGLPRRGVSLFDNIRQVDSGWGIVEYHPASIAFAERLPTHQQVYRSISRTLNAGPQNITPMWGSHVADRDIFGEEFRSYDAFTGTAFEYQLIWWLRKWQSFPIGSLVFPFGNPLVKSDDGWTPGTDTKLELMPGSGLISGNNDSLVLKSPRWQGMDLSGGAQIIVEGKWDNDIQGVVNLQLSSGESENVFLTMDRNKPGFVVAFIEPMSHMELEGVELVWSLGDASSDSTVLVDEISLRFDN